MFKVLVNDLLVTFYICGNVIVHWFTALRLGCNKVYLKSQRSLLWRPHYGVFKDCPIQCMAYCFAGSLIKIVFRTTFIDPIPIQFPPWLVWLSRIAGDISYLLLSWNHELLVKRNLLLRWNSRNYTELKSSLTLFHITCFSHHGFPSEMIVDSI